MLHRSLRLRLTATLSLGLGLLLALVFAGIDLLADRALYGEMDASLDKQARAILTILRSSSPEAMRNPMNALMPEFRRDIRSDFFQIRDADGVSISKSDSCGEEDIPAPPAFEGSGPEFFEPRLPGGETGRAAAVRERLDNLPARYRQPVTVVVAEATADMEELEDGAHWLLLGALVLCLALCALLAGFAVRRGLRPLDQVGERAAQLAASPYAPLPAVDLPRLPAELAPVVRSLDAALARLLAALERERRFARSVAHELRTPLAELRSSAELALRLDASEAVRRELHDIVATTAEMARALEAVLDLARYEGGLAQPEPEPLDLRGLLERQLAQQAERLAERGLRLALALPRTLWVNSHPPLLARVIANLLQNAIDYAPADSTVGVTASLHEDGVVLRVRNAAPGLDAAQLGHFGEAHWRADRGRDAERHGGLGLHLARAIADVLGLRLSFHLDAGSLVASLDGLACVVAEGDEGG